MKQEDKKLKEIKRSYKRILKNKLISLDSFQIMILKSNLSLPSKVLLIIFSFFKMQGERLEID